MNKLKKIAINLIPVSKWRKAIRKYAETDYSELFSPILVNTLTSDEADCKFDDEIVYIYGVKFKKINNLTGIAESFGRRDYEFGGLKDYIFIDVGANMGDSALFASHEKNCKKVYSYEPFVSAYNLANENLALNKDLAKKIKLYNYGWGGVLTAEK